MEITSIERIYDDGNHNAFTDLCRFKDRYYLTFRSCPDGHMLFPSSRILVLTSTDGSKWTRCFEFEAPERDVRDPHLLVFNGALFVYSGTWPIKIGDPNFRDIGNHLGFCARTTNGIEWEGPIAMESTRGYYIWRVTEYDGTVYLNGRRARPGTRTTSQSSKELDIEGCILASSNGLDWALSTVLPRESRNEAALLIDENGSFRVVARGWQEENAHLLSSYPPYIAWSCIDLETQIGGPFLAAWGETLLTGGRITDENGKKVTALFEIDGTDLKQIATLPSGGDTSYPGFCAIDDTRALLSFYSSHEGSGTSRAPSSIYLARITRE